MKLRPRTRPTFVFRVAGGGSIKFSVRQVAPVCRTVGSFTVRARAGLNRLRFTGRVRGHRLRTGTYQIRARRGKATIFRKILVVGHSSPAANTCAGGSNAAFAGVAGGGASAGPGGSAAAGKHASGREHGGSTPAPGKASGVLGAQASKILPGSSKTQFGLLIALATAIFLLGLGALPRDVIPHPAAAAFVARHRTMVASTGFAVLAAFLTAYFT